MIQANIYHAAMRALTRLIVHAKAKGYESDGPTVSEFLNDVELLPEFIADEKDRTGDFVEMLQSIVQMHPDCKYIVDEFEQAATEYLATQQ